MGVYVRCGLADPNRLRHPLALQGACCRRAPISAASGDTALNLRADLVANAV